MGLWYPKDFGFELIAYSDADHVGCKDDCKSTSGGLQFLGGKLVSWSSKKTRFYLQSDSDVLETPKCIAILVQSVPKYELADLFTKTLPKERFNYLVHRIVIIMAQQQHAADVHPDELCPPNKRYDLMDANKKVDLEHVQCPPESKILTNIIKNHPLRFSIAASSSVPWIYMAQFWHTLKEDGSKYRLTFMLDKKELSLTLDDFRTIFHLPQANADNHDSFVTPPSFLDMVPFYKQQLGFTMELKTSSSFKTTGLLQPWQTLCKIFSKCLTTRVTGWDQPPLQIMQMMYCFVNNIHVDYAELLWEGLYYSLHHPTSSIPYPRFTKIIISHYMTSFLEISRRARDRYHNLKDDDIMKNIFNSGRYKDKVGMQIPYWMISEEIKHTKHYQMYVKVFGLDVPLTQSQPTESTQGTHRTLSAPRSPNPKMDKAESSDPKRSTVIRFRLPERISTRLTPPAPVPTVDKADEMILQDTLQIEKMVEGLENVIDDSLLHRNDEPKIPGTRLEPKSDKESLEVEITNDEEVEITNVVIPVNVNEEEDEITDEVYELKRREKGKIVEESRSTPFPTLIRSSRIHIDLVSLNTEKFQELTGRYTYLFEHLKARFLSRKSFDTLADHLQEVMVESLPTMVDTHIKEQVKKQVPEQVRDQVPVYVAEGLILERQKTKEEMERMIAKAILQELRSYMSGHILHVHPVQSQTPSVPEQQYQLYLSMKADPQLQQQDIAIWLALQMKFESLQVPQTTCRTSAVRPRDQDDPHDDAHPEGENRAKRQKTSEYEAYVSGESSSGQVNENEQGPSTSGNQEQEDDYDFWTESYASDDDEIPTKQMSQDIMEEVSLTIDEAKLKKMVDEMLRQRCTSGDEHQYNIDRMKNFLKNDIRDPEAPPLSLINQDLLYLKKGSLGPEKIVLSLHKFPVIIFNDDDIEERTSRWETERAWKPKEVIYSNSKLIQVIKTYWELGHEHKFITEIVARRANECIVSITEPNYKNLNKNDIEDMYLLILNGNVPDYVETGLLWSLSVFIRSSLIWERVHDFQLGIKSYQKKVNLNALTISFPGVEKHKMFSIIYEPVHGIIYKNSKKEKRVMRHSKIHKFCDATLKRVLEGLRSYNNDVNFHDRLCMIQDKQDLSNLDTEVNEICDRVKLLIEGSELSLQERQSKLYDEFDTFTSVLGETIHSYYLRFAQLINDMHMIGMSMKPLQVNTKFVNHIQLEWSKFVMDVKLAKDLHNTNFDHLYAYLRQHEAHVNKVRLVRQRYPDPLTLVANTYHLTPTSHTPAIHQQPQASFPQLDSELVVPLFLPSDDPIASLNKAMESTTTSIVSTLGKGYSLLNCQEDGHMARQCTKPKRPRNSAWFKENMLLVEALESRVVLDKEQMEFLADNKDTVTIGQESQEILTLAIFQTDDLDAFDSDCDEAPSASVVLMAKLSAYDSEPSFRLWYHNPVYQYLQETQNKVVQDTNSSAQQDAMIMYVIEEMSNQVGIGKEITDMKEVFNQIEIEAAKCSIERKYFETEKKELFIENDRLLKNIICQDVMCIAMHSDVETNSVLPANDNRLEYVKLEKSYIYEYS
ncbi:hypothetical protein Tco_0276999 [Tanacetum coccineum]